MHQVQAQKLSQPSAPSRSEWGPLLSMVPASIGLMSGKHVVQQGLELLANAANAQRHFTVRTSARAMLRDARLPVTLRERHARIPLVPPEDLKRTQRRWLGQVALELYFTQLFHGDTAILDLRPSSLGIDESGDAAWQPRPLYVRWEASFVASLRDVYAGFFLDNAIRLDRGLRALGLEANREALLNHFGNGDQRGVRFDATQLEATLARTSRERPDGASPLHQNFAAFGLYVTGLHSLLEALDMSFDVRSAFMRAYRER